MIAQEQFTQISTDCQVEEVGGSYQITGSFQIFATIDPTSNELDDIVELLDNAGQEIKRNMAAKTLEKADQRAAQLAQDVAPHLRKHGKRSFTIIAPYGRLQINRVRLFDPNTGKTSIPSALLWKTSQHEHITSSLARQACKASQQMPFRQAQKALCDTSATESLISHSTVWNLKQDEGEHNEKAQQQFIADILAEHHQLLQSHGFVPPQEQTCHKTDKQICLETDKQTCHETDKQTCLETDEEDCCSEEVEEQARKMFQYFTEQPLETTDENDIQNDKPGDDASEQEIPIAEKKPRRVAKDVILVQPDEVVTKSQEEGCKQNKTFTSTMENEHGRCEYLAAATMRELQLLMAGILILWCLFSGKTLEVLGDGASWIGTWVGSLTGVEVRYILCWYHLCKKVCFGLSGLGTNKAERELLQREILGCLWKKDVSGAIAKLQAILPQCRVASRVQELIDYLERKRNLIVDYEARHAAGYWIASTRVERWNGLAVSNRCKHRGMSWTCRGVLAIALNAAAEKANQFTHAS